MFAKRFRFGKKDWLKDGIPPRIANRYFVNHLHRLIYCPVEKNSCTYLKKIMVHQSEHAQDFEDSGLDIHSFLKRKRVLRVESEEILLDPAYKMFVVIREPIERIVSAYLNKFVRNLNPPMVVEAIKQHAQLTGAKVDLERSLTFREFIDLLDQQPNDRDLDPHWKPQSVLIGIPIKEFDYVIPMERMNEFIDLLENRMGVSLSREKTHNYTNYDSYELSEKMYDRPPADLRTLERRPDKTGLVTEEIATKIKRRYAKDFELYEYATSTFDSQLND